MQDLTPSVAVAGVVALTFSCAAFSGGTQRMEASRIAFVDHDGEVVTVNADGSGSRRVTKSGTVKISPAWSPAGRQLAFATQVGPFDDVFVVKQDGGALGRVTRGAHVYSLAWSPDGTRLLLSLSSARGREGIAEVLLDDRPAARLRRIAGSGERLAFEYSPDAARSRSSRVAGSTRRVCMRGG